MKKNNLIRNIVLALAVLLISVPGCGKEAARDNRSSQSDNGTYIASGTLAATQGSDNAGYEKLEIKYQGWAGQVTVLELAGDLGYLSPLKLKWMGNTISGPQDIQATQSGDIDIGGAFMTAIINLIAAKGDIISVTGISSIDGKVSSDVYVLEDSPIKSGRDLIGKSVSVNTLGAHNEVMLKLYLKKEGLTDEEIKRVSLIVVPPTNAEQALRSGQVEATFLSGVLKDKAVEKGGVRSLFSDADLVGKATYSAYVMRKKYLEANPNTSKKLLEGISRAIEWSKETPKEEVIARMKKIMETRKRQEDIDSLKYWKSYGCPGKGGLIYDSDVQIWIDWLVSQKKITEGQFKLSDIYTNDYNPFKGEPQSK